MPPADQPNIMRGAELLKVLGNPVRLGVILELEEHGEQCVHELVASLDVSQPLMSQHLRVLRSANLIVGRRDGKEIRYVIADDHVIHIVRDAIRHAEEART
ncbi:MAG: ArsR/SmtB family transcription factor [Acidimicrobiales bacterium]